MTLTPLDIVARQHRQAQARDAGVAAREVRRAFETVDLAQPAQVRLAVDAATPTLLQLRARSASRSRAYYSEARQLALGNGRIVDPIIPEDDTIEDRIRTSLWVTSRGRYERRRARKGELWARATNIDEAAGTAVRHVLDGGRENTIRLVKADSRAKGFVRVTAEDDKVCYFCVMLASREDYKRTSFDKSDPRFAVGGNPMANAKVHDRCRCSLRPVFEGEMTPALNLRARTLWYELSEGDGKEALRSFRRNYEALLRQAGESVWQAA